MKFLLYVSAFFGTIVCVRYGLGWPTGVGVAYGFLALAVVFIFSIPVPCETKPEPYQCWHELRNDLMPESNVPVERILERCGGAPPPNATVCKGWKRDERRAAAWLVGRMLGSNSMEWFAVVNMWASQGRTSPPSEPEPRRASVKDVMAFAAGMMEKVVRETIVKEVMKSSSLHTPPAFRVGQWVRVKAVINGSGLAQIGDMYPCPRCGDGTLEVVLRSNQFGDMSKLCDFHIELALPRKGETWEFVDCLHHSSEARFFVADKDYTLDHVMAVWSRCGCVRPFGESFCDVEPNCSGICDAKPAYGIGQWVRLAETGRLMRVDGIVHPSHDYHLAGDRERVWNVPFGDILPAVPKIGEYWSWSRCKHEGLTCDCGPGEGPCGEGVFCALADWDVKWRPAVVCGCLAPVNFGGA